MSNDAWAWTGISISAISFVLVILLCAFNQKIKFLKYIWDRDMLRMGIGFFFLFWSLMGLTAIAMPYSSGMRIWHWQLGIEEAPWDKAKREHPAQYGRYDKARSQAVRTANASTNMLNMIQGNKSKEEIEKATAAYLKELQTLNEVSKDLKPNE